MTLLEARNYVNKLSLYKEKDMSDSNNYSINLDINNNSKFKENKQRRGYIFDKNLNNFVPYLARQKKTNKIIFYILLILVVISLIQLPFLDKTSHNQKLFFLLGWKFTEARRFLALCTGTLFLFRQGEIQCLYR